MNIGDKITQNLCFNAHNTKSSIEKC